MENQDICSNLALLVVDIQEPFVKSVPDSKDLLSRVSFACEAAELLGIKVIATEQKPEKLGETHPDIKHVLKDAPIFAKSSFSAVKARGLIEWMDENEIEHVIVCGLEVPICIYQSCIDLLNDDKDVTVLSDAVSGRRKDDCNSVKEAIIRHGCHWLPSESIFYSILGDADHPAFKSFTELVKIYNK